MKHCGASVTAPGACLTGNKKALAGRSRKGLKTGGPSGTRTPNQLIKSQLLYQLS